MRTRNQRLHSWKGQACQEVTDYELAYEERADSEIWEAGGWSALATVAVAAGAGPASVASGVGAAPAAAPAPAPEASDKISGKLAVRQEETASFSEVAEAAAAAVVASAETAATVSGSLRGVAPPGIVQVGIAAGQEPAPAGKVWAGIAAGQEPAPVETVWVGIAAARGPLP